MGKGESKHVTSHYDFHLIAVILAVLTVGHVSEAELTASIAPRRECSVTILPTKPQNIALLGL